MSGAGTGVLIWSAAAAVWWFLAIALVQGSRRTTRGLDPGPVPPDAGNPRLTLFKPLPTVPDLRTRDALANAIATFLPQLDNDSQLLVGVPEEQADLWKPVLDLWTRQVPSGCLRVVVRETPRQRANPKVAWLEVLAPEATGELWLWSDADVVAPPGLLTELRRELAVHPEAGGVTTPYGIRSTDHPAGWWDALFVNMEFLPGSLLLRRLGPVPLAFGAAILFRAETFRRRVSWEELGASLADDHEVGRRLAPVVISRVVTETCALETRLGPALRHVYRWQKTIRWCRPGGFAALVAILPLLGWAVLCGLQPADPRVWLGGMAQYAFEVLVAGVLMRQVGFRGPAMGGLAVIAWPAVRAGVWLAAWLPIPVTWGDTGHWERPVR
ncbi:MAG: hypothetical protein JNL10_20435 [Verrucomicrobiales bacterium]|nr:hypothetical protein [Verrucomicrobiales bacterium]